MRQDVDVGWQREQLEAAVPDLGADEAIVERWGANHTRGQVATGGRLWLTTRRLVFVPTALEAKVMGRSVWSCRLADVTGVSIARRGLSATSGEWRRRLAVHHSSGSDLFVVNHVRTVAETVRGALTGELHHWD